MKKVKLGELLIYEQPTKYLVNSDLYNDNYKTPVLTAGKSFLLGYTNEKENIFDDIPVIIFDDFTTASQYVDFPFKVKSSAMKILHCNYEKTDIRYIFYQLQRINIDTRRHKRYWISEFANIEIPLPPLSQQKAIAAQLDKAQELVKYNEQLIEKYDELQQSLFLDMFGDPVINEKEWEIKELSDVCEIRSGRNQKLVENDNGEYPIVGSGGIMGYADNYICPENTVVLGRKGTINSPFYMNEKFWNVDTAFGLIANNIDLHSIYLFYFSVFFNFLNLNVAVTIPSLRKIDISKIKVPVPPLTLQNDFAQKIESIEIQKEQAKEALAKSKDIFQGLLQEHFM